MGTLLIAVGAFVGYILAYRLYGRWLARRVFRLDADAVVPSVTLRDDRDYVPTAMPVVFGHHFTSIAGTGPIVGPAIAVMWGWLPALVWVLVGSVFIGAVHDFGSLVISVRNRGHSVGDIAGRVLTPRVRLLFLFILFLGLTIVLAIFGLVIAAVFRQYPAAVFPCVVQIPIAVTIGVYLHRRGVGLLVPSLLALALMYATVILGDWGPLHAFNAVLAGWSTYTWVLVLLAYSFVASVLPVWSLLQPRDFINSLQLLTALGLVVVGIAAAAFLGGAPPVPGAARPPLEIAAPVATWSPEAAPLIFPFLFITIACGAISGFHCLVSSGTTSKQLRCETDALAVGFGSMLTEGFLATIVILACVAGLGLGVVGADGTVVAGEAAWASRYTSWATAGGLGAKVGAFVDGSANFLRAFGVPAATATALMGVLVASFAGTTLDTACRLQRYVVQELAGTVLPADPRTASAWNPARWLASRWGATLVAVVLAAVVAALPPSGVATGFGAALSTGGLAGGWEWLAANGGKGGLILWPMFGATNQLLGGLAFLVICFWLWRRNLPVWFAVPPMLFMLVMPAWAMIWQLFVSNPGGAPGWLHQESPNWTLVVVGIATLVLEAWMIVEALLLWPRVRGRLERELPAPAAPLPEGSSLC